MPIDHDLTALIVLAVSSPMVLAWVMWRMSNAQTDFHQ